MLFSAFILTPKTLFPCAIVAKEDNTLELQAISDEFPLSTCVHFVGGVDMPPTPEAAVSPDFEGMYASLGVSVLVSVLNGNCAFDVMLMMLGKALSDGARLALRALENLGCMISCQTAANWMQWM